jgi:hypothetical protein
MNLIEKAMRPVMEYIRKATVAAEIKYPGQLRA